MATVTKSDNKSVSLTAKALDSDEFVPKISLNFSDIDQSDKKKKLLSIKMKTLSCLNF